ncbi:MAG: ABC transporter ATP-binding protein [Anaerolineae bacterium]|nr:ABC transporter ATP-binding protein [Anaerolineae bacterium]
MNQPDTYVIETHGLSKTYGNVQALRALDLKVRRNSIFGFLGPNGAGKTTTMKLLLGLARPTGGGGTILGHDILHDNAEIRKHVGYLAQDPRFYDHMTARETLRFTARFFYSGPAEAIEARIEDTLRLVGLEDKANRPVRGFSGGERQRLGIAQAQINYPDLLILDEPAASLDPGGRRDVLEVMERLRKYTTIFYSTHILDDVQKVSDTVAILNKGQLIAQAPIEQLLAGSEGTVYALTLRGDAGRILPAVNAQPWVKGVSATTAANGLTHWQVSVSDESAAEAQLLRLVLADESVTVTEFGRRRYELEDIFLRMTEGGEA